MIAIKTGRTVLDSHSSFGNDGSYSATEILSSPGDSTPVHRIIIGERAAEVLRNEHRLETSPVGVHDKP